MIQKYDIYCFLCSFILSESIIASRVVISHLIFLDVFTETNIIDYSYVLKKPHLLTSLTDFKLMCSLTSLLLPLQLALVVSHGPLPKSYIFYSLASVLFFLFLTCLVKLMALVIVSVQVTSKISLPILTSLPKLQQNISQNLRVKIYT